MQEFLPNLVVQRAIPKDTLLGLALGHYKLHGGVVRWASGSENAGQIVRHLIPVTKKAFDTPLFNPVTNTLQAVNTYQLNQISGQVKSLAGLNQQIFQMSQGMMALSGLNLAVSAVGFLVVINKLNKLEAKLNQIQKDVKEIRSMLEIEERSRLAAVLKDLLTIIQVEDLEHRKTILFNAKNTLAPISIKYRELLGNAETIESAVAYEEYFCLTQLAYVRCLAELGMLNIAKNELQEGKEFWEDQTRRISKDFLLGNDPERFLYSDLSQSVPVSTLVSWLDFAYSEEKGYTWIDELRIKNQPWYKDVGKEAMKFTSSFFGGISNYAGGIKSQGIGAATSFWKTTENKVEFKSASEEEAKVIPSLQKFVARSNVFEGYTAQYELMEFHKITPSELDKKIEEFRTEDDNGFLILEPAKKKV